MILRTPGDEFQYNEILYKIGEPIIGTEQSEYEGLIGSIVSITDGEDKRTENSTPDFYCCFDPPVLPYDIKQLEEIFSDLYDFPKTLEDIILDYVIMAPEMVIPVQYAREQRYRLPLYILSEDWAINGENGRKEYFFSDEKDAKNEFTEKLNHEADSGCVSNWDDLPQFCVDSGSYFYECWLDGEYMENHYKISIKLEMLMMSPGEFGRLGHAYQNETFQKDFLDQVAQSEEVSRLTDAQYHQLISDSTIAERIHKALGRNDAYRECYWATIHEIIKELSQFYSTDPDLNTADKIDD